MRSLVIMSLVLMAARVLSIVNAVRLTRLRDDVDKKAAGAGGSLARGSATAESMVVRNNDGVLMPKKGYWLEVAPETGVVDGTNTYQLVLAAAEDTDAVAFAADVDSGRIQLFTGRTSASCSRWSAAARPCC
jgi:hypothetical protein